MNKPQAGFTLLELVIAIAIFALLGLGCWRLFDAVVRVERSSTAQQQALRSLQRAVAMIERDVLQAQSSAQSPGVVLYPDKLEVRRVNWRNPLGLPRSEVQVNGATGVQAQAAAIGQVEVLALAATGGQVRQQRVTQRSAGAQPQTAAEQAQTGYCAQCVAP